MIKTFTKQTSTHYTKFFSHITVNYFFDIVFSNLSSVNVSHAKYSSSYLIIFLTLSHSGQNKSSLEGFIYLHVSPVFSKVFNVFLMQN